VVGELIFRDRQFVRWDEVLPRSAKVRDEDTISTYHEEGTVFPAASCLEDDLPNVFFMVRIFWGQQTGFGPLGK
jgi:hypothetical protein